MPANPDLGTEADATARAKKLRLLVLDVDGVLTDGRLYYGEKGEALKAFDVRDGLGIKLAQASGIEVAILSARASPIVAQRARELGIARILLGQSNKLGAFNDLRLELGFEAEQCGFVGDDLPDLALLKQVGFAATVCDAAAEIKQAAHFIASREGGRGAVRQIIEYLMRAQSTWDAAVEQHLKEAAHA